MNYSILHIADETSVLQVYENVKSTITINIFWKSDEGNNIPVELEKDDVMALINELKALHDAIYCKQNNMEDK